MLDTRIFFAIAADDVSTNYGDKRMDFGEGRARADIEIREH